MYHHSEDTHLCGTAVVDLRVSQPCLGFIRQFTASGGEPVNTEISGNSRILLLPDVSLEETNESDQLKQAKTRDLGESTEAIGDVRELKVGRLGDITGETVVLLNQVANDGKH
mmetsp:Transcript_10292/g.15495  ORF Transcript_10292/g.15495 Transcript_10292/m.15495 type:complete len:113 (-) Transcript_10292:365-703(-)